VPPEPIFVVCLCRLPAGQELLSYSVRTGSGTHPPEALSAGVKWPGREADYSPPSSAEVENA
jgi:hypothetical protein